LLDDFFFFIFGNQRLAKGGGRIKDLSSGSSSTKRILKLLLLESQNQIRLDGLEVVRSNARSLEWKSSC
jgi:hypothetical protein